MCNSKISSLIGNLQNSEQIIQRIEDLTDNYVAIITNIISFFPQSTKYYIIKFSFFIIQRQAYYKWLKTFVYALFNDE